MKPVNKKRAKNNIKIFEISLFLSSETRVRQTPMTGLTCKNWLAPGSGRPAHAQEVVPYPPATSTEVHGAHTTASMTRP